MLGASKVIALVPMADPSAARAFYEDVLGLTFVADEPYALVFDAAGVVLRLARTPDFTPPPYAVLGWQVDDIRSAAQDLAAKGVVFQRYDGMEQDELGIWFSGQAHVAWFKDPSGNVLSLTEMVGG